MIMNRRTLLLCLLLLATLSWMGGLWQLTVRQPNMQRPNNRAFQLVTLQSHTDTLKTNRRCHTVKGRLVSSSGINWQGDRFSTAGEAFSESERCTRHSKGTVPHWQSQQRPASGNLGPQIVANTTSSVINSIAITTAGSSSNGIGKRAAAALPTKQSLLLTAAPELGEGSDPPALISSRSKLEAAASTPINIAFMTSLFWELPQGRVRGCQVDGIPLDCRIHMGGSKAFLNNADALCYHVPTFSGTPRAKAFPQQLRVAMSLESGAYYPQFDEPGFMCQFDAEMSYRTCAQVTMWYALERFGKLFEAPPVPFEDKLHAVAYINSNCEALSGRSEIMRALIRLGDKAKVPVHALGGCDTNMPWPLSIPRGQGHKVEVMRKYKFCVAMENSVRHDYVTEKIWDALAAGCIPIYLGSKTARHIIPDPQSIIIYDLSGRSGHASTPAELDIVMHAVGSNKQQYEARMAWKHRQPEDQPSQTFRDLWRKRHTTKECFLCQFLARQRAEPREHYRTCLFNRAWMETAGQPYAARRYYCQ